MPPTPEPDTRGEARTFRRRHRLSLSRDYQAVFAARLSARRGPIVLFGRPSERPEPRLGLSIGRRVGNAVVRNALKRRLREAFRLTKHKLPPCYDWVVTARAHRRAPTSRYIAWLNSAAEAVDAQRRRKQRQTGPDAGVGKR